jgi:hypothetical protein
MSQPQREQAMFCRQKEISNMKNYIGTTLLAAMLLVSPSVFAAQFSVGIRIGAPPAPRVVRVVPASPGPGYMRIDGYWYPVGKKYKWHDGYWTQPPYAGARWVSPRHDGAQYYQGYWDGDKGQQGHDHHSDHQRDRDYRR